MPLAGIPTRKIALAAAGLVADAKPFMSVERQCRAHWCWAAVCVSIARRYGIVIDQAAFARKVLGDAFPAADCSNPPCDATSTKCSVPAMALPIDDVPLDFERVAGPLSKEALIEEMKHQRPVAAKIIWQSAAKPAGGHYIAIVGMTESAGDVLFHPGDPMDTIAQAVPYEKLVRYQQDGDWKVSWRKAG